jgi:hypothetical protein
MLGKLTVMGLTISAALAALTTEPSLARPWRGAVWSSRPLPGGGLRYGWGAYGLGFYGYAVPIMRIAAPTTTAPPFRATSSPAIPANAATAARSM